MAQFIIINSGLDLVVVVLSSWPMVFDSENGWKHMRCFSQSRLECRASSNEAIERTAPRLQNPMRPG